MPYIESPTTRYSDGDGLEVYTGSSWDRILMETRDRYLDADGAGGEIWADGLGVDLANGVNGERGDSISSDTACGVGATFGFGQYINFTADKAHDTKGALVGGAVYGELADNESYGEIGAYVSYMTNNRDGGLAEGFEATVEDNTGGGRNVGIALIMKMQETITRWCRAIWCSSQGSETAGDAIYVDGPGGWTNVLVAKDSGGSTVAQIAGNGDATFNFINSYGFVRRGDPNRFVSWYDGDPNGVVSASPGAMILNTAGGAGTTLFVKESGVGTNTGWVGK